MVDYTVISDAFFIYDVSFALLDVAGALIVIQCVYKGNRIVVDQVKGA